MNRTSWVEICVSDFAQSIRWFEHTLGFRVVTREGDDYAELSYGETTIQLAADNAPYWASERSHLLPLGQRGSRVEIVLLVEDVEAVYQQALHAKADIVREIADYPWQMRQFWVRHPDGYLIRPAQKIISVNLATYRSQIADAFHATVPRVTDKLTQVRKIADTLVRQHDFLEAATLYETLITEIFEESHLYTDEEEEEYDNDEYYNDNYQNYAEESSHPEEEGLEAFVGECIETLGRYLADTHADGDARKKIVTALFDIYLHDVNVEESLGFAASASDQLVQYANRSERDKLIGLLRKRLSADNEDTLQQTYGKFLLQSGQEILDDEVYLRICRDTGLTVKLGRKSGNPSP